MLPRAARLKRNRDFRSVYARRLTYATSNLTLYVRPRPQDPDGAIKRVSRFGFVISKKIAKRAHDRNLLKRRLREICRHSILSQLPETVIVDAMFVARSSAPGADFSRLVADMEKLGRQAGLL